MWAEKTYRVSLNHEILCFMPFALDEVAGVEIINRVLDGAAALVEDKSNCSLDILCH